jgi:hypothetical protein
MYWLRQLGIEKGKPFNPTERQREILIDAAETGELMAKALVYNERMDGVLRQNNWRMILGGEWGDGHKYTNRMKYWDAIDPRSRYTYEAITTSPAMTMPKPGKGPALYRQVRGRRRSAPAGREQLCDPRREGCPREPVLVDRHLRHGHPHHHR